MHSGDAVAEVAAADAAGGGGGNGEGCGGDKGSPAFFDYFPMKKLTATHSNANFSNFLRGKAENLKCDSKSLPIVSNKARDISPPKRWEREIVMNR